MKLTLKNIGKIGTASVEINGITVIAGENNTGKSTVGKALYCLFTAFHNINDKIVEERSLSIYRAISAPFRKRRAHISMTPNGLRRIAEEICKNRTRYIDSTDELRKVLEGIYKNNEVYDIGIENGAEDSIDAIFSKVFSYLKLEDNTIKANVLKNILQSEFNMQISHVNAQDLSSSMVLEFHGEKCINVEVVNNEDINIKSAIDIYSNLAYLEDPFVIDELANDLPFRFIRSENHRTKLTEMLTKKRNRSIVSNVIEEMIVSEKLEQIFYILNHICEGNLTKQEDGYFYTSAKYDAPLALSNISTGFKTFLILKTLLMNGAIEEGGTIILDEPEIHLHPEWQLVFAELIVLIHKEFGIHVLLNTHSPYFLNAIEVYAVKHGIDDKCKYYLASSNAEVSNIEDVTNHIEAIYSKLARPLQDLENERGQL